MYMSYSLTRSFDYDLSTAYGITVDGDDAINCAHMLAAGFNTMSRSFMGDFVLAVVDTKHGTVEYDGKIEKIERPDSGVTDLRAVLRARDAEIEELRQALVELAPARNAANEAARAELIEHVKRAYAKWGQVDPGRQREGLKSHLRGMLEVLSKYLVAIGEADADERHAVALRVCEIPEGNYLYDDA